MPTFSLHTTINVPTNPGIKVCRQHLQTVRQSILSHPASKFRYSVKYLYTTSRHVVSLLVLNKIALVLCISERQFFCLLLAPLVINPVGVDTQCALYKTRKPKVKHTSVSPHHTYHTLRFSYYYYYPFSFPIKPCQGHNKS